MIGLYILFDLHNGRIRHLGLKIEILYRVLIVMNFLFFRAKATLLLFNTKFVYLNVDNPDEFAITKSSMLEFQYLLCRWTKIILGHTCKSWEYLLMKIIHLYNLMEQSILTQKSMYVQNIKQKVVAKIKVLPILLLNKPCFELWKMVTLSFSIFHLFSFHCFIMEDINFSF